MQGFPQYILHNNYLSEEDLFKEKVQVARNNKVDKNANIISSHVIYKIKVNNDGTLKLKARRAPHGNENITKNMLRTYSCMGPPTGVHILLSTASLFSWLLTTVDVEAVF